MGLPVRIALILSLTIALSVRILPGDNASAQMRYATNERSLPVSAVNPALHPLQTNPTPDATVTAGATVVVTNTSIPVPTQTPAPTATSVPATPSASSLLTAARAALKSANTSHFNLIEKLNLGGLVAGTIREQGALSQRPSEAKAHITGSLSALGKPQKIDEHHVQIKNKAWVKSAKTHGLWKSEKATPPSAAGSVQNPLDLVKGNGLKLTGLKTVGAQTFGTIPVWRIHGTVIAQVTQAKTTTGTVDYLIARNGNLPYRIMENVNDPKDGLLLNLQVTLSGFGKKVTIATPKIGGKLR